MSRDLRGIKEISSCSSETRPHVSRHCCTVLVSQRTQRASPLLGLHLSIPCHAPHHSLSSGCSALTAVPQTHPVFSYLKDSAQARPSAWNTSPQAATRLTFSLPQVSKSLFPWDLLGHPEHLTRKLFLAILALFSSVPRSPILYITCCACPLFYLVYSRWAGSVKIRVSVCFLYCCHLTVCYGAWHKVETQ